MSTYTTIPLSAATTGEPIAVTGTTTGTSVLAHTSINVGGDFDEIELFANNQSASSVELTVEVGGTAASDLIIRTIPPYATKLVLEGIYLNGGATVQAFATVANVVNLFGKVGRTE